MTPGRSVSGRFARAPIRHKLLALVLLPLLVVLPLLGLTLLVWGNHAFDRLLITKVRSDLAVAEGYFERVVGDVGASTAAVAESQALSLALERGDGAELVALLHRVKTRERLDFIALRTPDGRLRLTDAGLAVGDDAPAEPPPALDASAHLVVLRPAAFAPLAPALAHQVSVRLVPTRNAAPTHNDTEARALVVLASAAVRDEHGALLGQVQGGVLLNHNLRFIDHINEIVYPEGALPFGSQGTATLFLGDVRISTNVRLFGDENHNRAVGTRVSQTVRDTVLGRGHTWLDRAFVVNDWYVSAYQPLVDARGERVAMLYVGFLEQPFTWVKYGALAVIGLIFFAVMVGAAFVSLRWARGIFAPLEQMAETMRRVETGALDARVGPVASRDEIGRLAGHLDHLLDVIDDKTQALQRWNAELDAKVEARTRDLAEAQQQLVRTEKMAAVGQLTASIAHEVNNPIAVLQGNLDLVRELLGSQALPVKAELRLMDEQIERMRLVVTQLLQFARPGEYAGYIEQVDVARVIDDCLVLVAHLLASTRIEVRRDFSATRRAGINRHELQQVLVNLLVNALHEMPDGGRLDLSCTDDGDDGVRIAIADTGNGLDEALLAELFRPFVTRRKDGTGLGLWISRGIVERYGGDLRAANRDDGVSGAVFSVLLKTEAQFGPAEAPASSASLATPTSSSKS